MTLATRQSLWRSLFSLGTLISGLIAVAIWSQEYDWATGLYLVLLLYLHEVGHVLAALWRKVRVTRPPVFLPGLGALVGVGPGTTRLDEVLVLLGGSVVGGAASLVIRQTGLALHQPALAFAGDLCLFINLLNLAPVRPLDGGRVAQMVGWFGLLPVIGVLIYAYMGDQPVLLVGSVLVLIVAGFQRFDRHQADTWPERLMALGLWLGAVALLVVPFVMTDRLPWLRAVPQPFQKAARVFAFVMLGFMVLGQYLWRTAWARERTAFERYFLLTFGCWMNPVMRGVGWAVPIWALALAQSVGLPGLRWLTSLAGYLARKGVNHAGSACAAGYDCLVRMGRTDEARAWLEARLPLLEQIGFEMLVAELMGLGYHTKALACMESRANGTLRPEELNPNECNNMAWALFVVGRAEEALPFARSAAARTPDNAPVLDTLGQVLLAVGDFPGAEESLRKAYARMKRAGTLVALARALAAQGRHAEAIASAERALATSNGFWPKDEPSEADVRRWLLEWKSA